MRDARKALLKRTMVLANEARRLLKVFGMRLMRTKGHRRAVARKLAVLLHRMWIDGTEFRQENVEGMI